LSTIGNISLGCALVAGRKRLPRPATGKTAFVIFGMIYFSRSYLEHKFIAMGTKAV
jgi:hypothetical protein